MASLKSMIEQLRADGSIQTIASDVRAQFGAGTRQYKGATLLPERLVPYASYEAYREESIRFRHGVIANASTRYSPVQMKDTGELVASFLVQLSESDKGGEMTAEKYDMLIKLLDRSSDMEAMSRVIQFIDNETNVPLVEYNEKNRWEAIVDSSVVMRGDGFEETIALANPTGHRAAAGGTWSSDAYDPWADLIAVKEKFENDLGYAFDENNGRIITSNKVANILLGNDKVKLRVFGGSSQVLGSTYILGSADRAGLDAKLNADGFPLIETYDLRYRTQTGTVRFLKEDAMVFVAATGEDTLIDLGDEPRYLDNTLGYTGVGRAAGQSSAGRVIKVDAFEDKPPRIESQAWQVSFPVILDPEAVQVRTGIA